MGLTFCLVFSWYLECILGKEKCRVNSSINLILFKSIFPEDFLMNLEGENKSTGAVGSREILFSPAPI